MKRKNEIYRGGSSKHKVCVSEPSVRIELDPT